MIHCSVKCSNKLRNSPPCSSSPQAQRCVTELKAQVNRLEAEMEDQRTQKQIAMVENEHLRMEVEALRSANVANVGAQIGFKEADSEYLDSCPSETLNEAQCF